MIQAMEHSCCTNSEEIVSIFQTAPQALVNVVLWYLHTCICCHAHVLLHVQQNYGSKYQFFVIPLLVYLTKAPNRSTRLVFETVLKESYTCIWSLLDFIVSLTYIINNEASWIQMINTSIHQSSVVFRLNVP